jgi:hypothetical protein
VYGQILVKLPPSHTHSLTDCYPHWEEIHSSLFIFFHSKEVAQVWEFQYVTNLHVFSNVVDSISLLKSTKVLLSRFRAYFVTVLPKIKTLILW